MALGDGAVFVAEQRREFTLGKARPGLAATLTRSSCKKVSQAVLTNPLSSSICLPHAERAAARKPKGAFQSAGVAGIPSAITQSSFTGS